MKLAVWVGLVLCLVGTAEAKSAKVVATVSKFNQVAEIPSTVIYTPRRAGLYRATVSIHCAEGSASLDVGLVAGAGFRASRFGAGDLSSYGSGYGYSFEGYVSAGQGVHYWMANGDGNNKPPFLCDIGVVIEDLFDVSSVPPYPTTTTTTLP